MGQISTRTISHEQFGGLIPPCEMKGTELSLSCETTLLLQDLALSTIQIHTLKVQTVQMHVQFY